MLYLVDGYNLLHAVGIVSRIRGPQGLEHSRLALLNFLAESLDPEEASQTTVVFDASDAPPGLPRVVEHRGLTVRFAVQHADADTLIEELIQTESAPGRLTVVSGDRRIQRAARRRKATAVSSGDWYSELVHRRLHPAQAAPSAPPKPPVPLLEEDVEYWFRQFGGQSFLEALWADQTDEVTDPAISEPPAEDPKTDPVTGGKLSPEEAAKLDNLFPPGYAEDLAQQFDRDEENSPYHPFPPGYGEDVDED